MDIVGFFKGFNRDIETLCLRETPQEIRSQMIVSVALRSLAILAMGIAVGAFIAGLSFLIAGSLVGIIPVITAVALVVLGHDMAVVGHNRGQIYNPEPSCATVGSLLLEGIAAAVEAGRKGGSPEAHFEYRGTWLFKHFV